MESMMMEMGPMMGSMKGGSTGQATEESGGEPNSQAGKDSDPKDPHGH